MSSPAAELFERVERLEEHRDALLLSLDQARLDARGERRRAVEALRQLHALDPDHEELDPDDLAVASAWRAWVSRNLFFVVAVSFMAVWMALIALFGQPPSAPPLRSPPTSQVVPSHF